MGRICRACRAEAPPDATFCEVCGSGDLVGGAPPPAPGAARLVVTLTDDPGSTVKPPRGRAGSKKAAGGPATVAGGGGGPAGPPGGGPGDPDGPSGAAPGPPRRWLWLIAALGALITLVAGAATVVIVRSGGSKAVAVTLRPVEYESPHPFTESVVEIDPATARRFARQARELRRAQERDQQNRSQEVRLTRVAGDGESLYGTRSEPVCDTTSLARQLPASSPASRAWARLMGVTPDRIATTIDSLTPVVLAHDTAVTNHIYTDGSGEPVQNVLEAGTAVLVDDHGAPRVQCSCGNPLLPPATSGHDVEVVGEPWDGFAPDRVVAVEPTPRTVGQLATLDVTTVEPTRVVTGGTTATTALDGFLVSDDEGVHVISEDGTRRTTVVDHPVAQVFDDGAGGLVYNELGPDLSGDGGPGGPQQAAERLKRPGTRSESQAAIWHLPAGALEPVRLVGSDSPNTRWAVAGATGTLGGRRVLAFVSLTSDPDANGSRGVIGRLLLRDLKTGRDREVEADAVDMDNPGGYGPKRDVTSITLGADRLGYVLTNSSDPDGSGRRSSRWVVRDSTLREVESGCEGDVSDTAGLEVNAPVGRCPFEGALFGLAGRDEPGLFGSLPSEAGAIFSTMVANLRSGEGTTFYDSLEGYNTGWDGLVALDAVDGRGVVSFLPDRSYPPAAPVLFDLATGRTRELPFHGIVRFLRARLVRPVQSVETPPTTAPDPEPTDVDLRGVDWKNRSYVLDGCQMGEDDPAATPDLRDGEWIAPDRSWRVELAEVAYGDLTGDAVDEAVLQFVCHAYGGNLGWNVALVVTSGADGPTPLGDAFVAQTTKIVGGALETERGEWTADDPRCCPSSWIRTTWRWRDGRWVSG